MPFSKQRALFSAISPQRLQLWTDLAVYIRYRNSRQYSNISKRLSKPPANSIRNVQPILSRNVNAARWDILPCKRNFNTQNLVWEENGQTLIRSPYDDVEIPEVSFAEYMFSKLDKHKNLTCIVDHLKDRSYTGAQLKEGSIKIASALAKMGYKKGDVILILATNCPEYSMVIIACASLGVVVSTANPVYTPGEVARQLSHSEAKGIVTLVSLVDTVNEAMGLDQEVSSRVKDIITIDGEREHCRPLATLLEDVGKSFPDSFAIDPASDVAALPYSSGTMGLPKGVMLTHRNLVANLQQTIEGPMKLRAGEDVLLGILPIFHIYGLVLVQFGAITQGAKLVMLPRFEPKSFLESIQKHKMTYLHIVPPLALFLAKQPEVDNYDLSSVKVLLSGAAPLGGQITEQVEQRLGAHFLQAYGFTEVSPLSHYDRVPPRKGTVGQLVSNTLGKIIDPETKKVCGPGEEGEIVLKGPQVMKGYHKNQEATDACIDDGWIYSGDIGRVDKDGYFTITDRLKELIKYKGYQVAPAELEAVICTHPSVQDAAVIGLKLDESVGEVPKAFVVLKPDTNVKPAEIEEFVTKNVAPYKRLRGGVEMISSIPKSASGKILRRMLRDKTN